MPKFLQPIDLSGLELQNVRAQNLATAPSVGAGADFGRIYYDTDDNILYWWNGSAWISAQGGTGAVAITAFDAKGDLLVGTGADAYSKQTVGADGTILVAASGQATGVQWRTLTEADIQIGTTARLVGRVTAGAGAAEEISLAADLEFSGGALRSTVWSGGDIAKAAGATSATINNDAVTYAKMQNVSATDRLLGRDTAAAGDVEEISLTADLEFTGAQAIRVAAYSGGDIAKAAGATSATINADAVTNTKLANMAANSIKGNNTGGAADPADLTVAQVKTLLAYAGSEVAFTPAANIAATNVQAAIEEAVADLTLLISTQIEARLWKDPVDAATTAALPSLTYNSGAGTLTATANAALAAQDGVTLAAGDDLLVKNQASSFQNGIYTVTQVGSGAAPFILTRRADASTANELRDATVMIEAGTTQAGEIHTQTNAALADLTAASQTWTKTGDSMTPYVADGTTINFSGQTIQVHTGLAGAGLTMAGGHGTALNVIAGTTPGTAGPGGGLKANADDLVIDSDIVVRKYAVDIGNGALTQIDITHNLGTRDVTWAVREVNSPWAYVFPDVEALSTTQLRLRFAVAPTASQYRVVVHA